jgi:hypothetical protein
MSLPQSGGSIGEFGFEVWCTIRRIAITLTSGTAQSTDMSDLQIINIELKQVLYI